VNSIDGVGSQPSTCSTTAVVPIALPEGTLATFSTSLIDQSDVPALWGLNSMTEKAALVDTLHNQVILVGRGGFEMKLSPGSTVLQCQRSPTGHMMLPCSSWEAVNKHLGRKKKLAFVAGPAAAASIKPN
jgi:hypothetical protein